MSDLISRQAAIDDVKAHGDGTPWEVVDILYMLNHLPSTQSELKQKIFEAGKVGKEIRINIDGRLFAIRELAQ